ncbi:hypothetical protein MLD38_028560 [Melastoma candidum]|uniref:Uncharacterized protein n=1 Tax=Melastoma candidum TaxID=119954 RepID=A0ACB9N792_9MYRT|nr:hypothetical protein MLD38_028560 [Melastoma candidum]
MAKLFATTVNFLFIVLVLLGACAIEARPLNAMSLKGLAIESNSGSSDGFFNVLLLGAMKQSGPSPGEGHKFTDSEAMDHIADKGPSTGTAHGFASSGEMAHVMDSGPSSGGGGH